MRAYIIGALALAITSVGYNLFTRPTDQVSEYPKTRAARLKRYDIMERDACRKRSGRKYESMIDSKSMQDLRKLIDEMKKDLDAQKK